LDTLLCHPIVLDCFDALIIPFWLEKKMCKETWNNVFWCNEWKIIENKGIDVLQKKCTNRYNVHVYLSVRAVSFRLLMARKPPLPQQKIERGVKIRYGSNR
jgi:hypothetical protein